MCEWLNVGEFNTTQIIAKEKNVTKQKQKRNEKKRRNLLCALALELEVKCF